ncbi:MAG: hypothetical protein ACRD4M_04410 [Candidatus Acidiferrales bacterium]
MSLHEMWRRMTTSRYTRALEAVVERRDGELARERAEIRRLRAENRALLNSILGIAGIPPVIAGEEEWSAAAQGFCLAPSANAAREAGTMPAAPSAQAAATKQGIARESARKMRAPGAHLAAPLRRRSWQQINRALEFASAQKKQPPEEIS